MELQNAVSVLLRFQAPRMSIFSLIGAEARETIVPLTETALVKYADNRSDAEAITPELLMMDNRPDAFFAVNDDTAIGILYTAKNMGLRVPDDVSICGFTNGNRAIACDPALTTVEQRGVMVGEEAANILIGKVEGSIPMDKAEKRIVRTRLIVRGTTR